MIRKTMTWLLALTLCVALFATGCDSLAKKGLTPTTTPTDTPEPAGEEGDTIGISQDVYPNTPAGYLANQVAAFDRAVYVYKDGADMANHFPRQVWMGSDPNSEIPAMNVFAPGMDNSTSIQATLDFSKHSWGGYYFEPPTWEDMGITTALSGAQKEEGDDPNPPTEDLSGAVRLTFWVRGENGGEQVEFFLGGLGWDGWKPAAFADSTQKISIGTAVLTTEWTRYEIPLDDVNLSRMSGGFAWVANDKSNKGADGITFYIDNIRYEYADDLEAPLLLTSYAPAMEGTDSAAIYDNAITAIALMRAGYTERAEQIADALVTLCSDGQWLSTTGNLAWAMLAMCELAENAEGPARTAYIDTAQKIAGVILECKSTTGTGGFEAGYEYLGSEQTRAYYKSTEHNIDLVAAFTRLAALCEGDAEAAALYTDAAAHAQAFVLAMLDPNLGCFYTGTAANGTTINRDVVPLDCQTWAILALGDALTGEQKAAALGYVEQKMRVPETDGYDFNTDRDGVWFEGTAQASLAYAAVGDTARAEEILAYLTDNENENGSITAADRDGVSTGFFIIGTGLPWIYGKQVHIGATAWLSLAESGENPFVASPRSES